MSSWRSFSRCAMSCGTSARVRRTAAAAAPAVTAAAAAVIRMLDGDTASARSRYWK